MFLALLLAQASASPPVPLHAGSNPCTDRSYPRVVDSVLIACGAQRTPTVRIEPQSLAVTDSHAPPAAPLTHGLIPPPMMGTEIAVAKDGVAWVAAGPQGFREVWWKSHAQPLPRPLEVGAADPHHPVTDGQWIAWVSQGNIKVFDPRNNSQTRVDANTGFNAPPSFHQSVLCWEERSDDDVDIACSDGVKLQRPGHQTHPIRTQHRLFFREQGLLWAWDMKP